MSRMADADAPDWDDAGECEQWHWEYQAFLDWIDGVNKRIDEAKEQDNGEL